MDNQRGSTAGFGIGGFLIGLLTGAVVAGIAVLLFAPRSGKETREIIKGKAVETQQMVQSRISDVKEKVNQIKSNMRSRAEEEAQSVDKTR